MIYAFLLWLLTPNAFQPIHGRPPAYRSHRIHLSCCRPILPPEAQR